MNQLNQPTVCPRHYDLDDVDQFNPPDHPDVIPIDDTARHAHLRALASDATIYGLPSAYQLPQLVAQAVAPCHPGYTGFHQFHHQRDVATPAFDAFLTPNVDTLYSNAWLDLTRGAAVIEIPPMPDRYFTLQFIDMYGNASNLSSRTVGPDGGRFTVAPTWWDGEDEPDTTRFRVATPYMWILMRILVRDGDDVATVRSLQDQVTIRSSADHDMPAADIPVLTLDQVQREAGAFFTALDWTIRNNGTPVQEAALVHRYRSIGVGADEPFDLERFDAGDWAAIESGFADAMAIVAAARSQVGERGPTGWNTSTAGELGFALLRRAVQNYVGTGGNVAAEKKFFVTFHDADNADLDGARHCYTIRFAELPPVDGHWSLTVYPQSTGLLMENPLDRYAISTLTPGLDYAPDGSLTIELRAEPPTRTNNWLPVPAALFYVDLRLWEPTSRAREGSWLPPEIRKA